MKRQCVRAASAVLQPNPPDATPARPPGSHPALPGAAGPLLRAAACSRSCHSTPAPALRMLLCCRACPAVCQRVRARYRYWLEPSLGFAADSISFHMPRVACERGARFALNWPAASRGERLAGMQPRSREAARDAAGLARWPGSPHAFKVQKTAASLTLFAEPWAQRLIPLLQGGEC